MAKDDNVAAAAMMNRVVVQLLSVVRFYDVENVVMGELTGALR